MTVQKKKKSNKGSKKARNSAARLAAVQAVYQMLGNSQKAAPVIEEFIKYRLGKTVDDMEMVQPDGALFKSIVAGVEEKRSTLDDFLKHGFGSEEKLKQKETAEPILYAVALCGAYELFAHSDLDAALIISDYLHVADAFFEKSEVRLINGILENVRQGARDETKDE